ncbi:type 1 glutamine amidotransferase domain-containing protein [Nocardia pseudobrasiliensis]|uniref:Putative intracellular protease/amidase n=1 Tax=Nocardia pseudobrasiliensis TaxID=45979 RepID=A0A370ICD5_9NOCA|nr:putative intracellular protease/amidase [Nocardia pseudobrasiliensis]
MKVLLPVPDTDFDVTEVAVPWHVLTAAGHRVVFAAEYRGTPLAADPLLLTGVLFGQLGAKPEAKNLYRRLQRSPEFADPLAWQDLDPTDYDGLLLPGGHASGVRQFLESTVLRAKVAQFWQLNRPVGAICHGVVLLARTIDPGTGHSVLYDRNTTTLPKYLERTAYYLTAWRRGRYYRTYPEYVEDEVRAALAHNDQYVRGNPVLTRHGTATDHTGAFTVRDRNYLSARWPGDAYLFAEQFRDMLSS